ncbi:hypothetical protein BCY86_06155 [Pajaroellobacter abortibovis]|uniref:arsenite-transporting ATPase n=1 Tax=Pajaroellobacter abortibovis TaxID=1882918 RepID=A0A1L6MZC7_9BACT|nr:hypothetical protein BCY86_06155 [Pajaroellobacter abortibovis]
METRRVLITGGCGGVGKTTIAAALGVAAALRGRHVLCMTIDPAKRLAQSLGIAVSTEPVKIKEHLFQEAGLNVRGSLTAMMLDTKRTFDEMVVQFAKNPEYARALLKNKLYQYVSTSLAGTHEYMAVQKLASLMNDSRYDLIIVDTPPTSNALEFLEAPQRLIEAFESPAIRWFIDAWQPSKTLSFDLLARSAAAMCKVMASVIGKGFLASIGEFLSYSRYLFGGFKERAEILYQTLHHPEVAFLLITSPSPASIKEILYLEERLIKLNIPRGAFVINRFHPLFTDEPWCEVIKNVEGWNRKERGISLSDKAVVRLKRAYADAKRMSELDERWVKMLEAGHAIPTPIVRIPELASDVSELSLLARMASYLVQEPLSC